MNAPTAHELAQPSPCSTGCLAVSTTTPQKVSCVCRNRVMAIRTPPGLKRRRWSKPAAFRPSSPKSKAGGMNCNSRGGIVSLTVFNRRHALPLPAGRFSRPRAGRREGAEYPRNNHTQRSWQQPVHDREQAAEQPRSRTIRFIEPVVSSQWQKPRPGPRPVRNCISGRQRLVRGQASGATAYSPWTVHVFNQSTTKPWQRIVRVRERALAPAIPCPVTRTGRRRSECGPVQTQSHPAYVLV